MTCDTLSVTVPDSEKNCISENSELDTTEWSKAGFVVLYLLSGKNQK